MKTLILLPVLLLFLFSCITGQIRTAPDPSPVTGGIKETDSILTEIMGTDKDIPSLWQVYEDHFKIGTCVELSQLQGTEAELLLKHYSSITAENIMKPQFMAPAEGTFNFENTDKLIDFALKNNKVVRGHTLLWHNQNAKWMFYDDAGNKVSKDVLLKRLETFINAVVSRYKGKVYAWDVVNEVVDSTALRKSEWFQIAGEEYIEKAFIYAHKADPNALLFLNEIDTFERVKSNIICDLVKRLLAKNIPVDGIGLQFHISLEYPNLQAISGALKKYNDLGLEIHITELDMSLNADPAVKTDRPPEDILIRQAHRYKEIFDILKSYKSITNVTFWGFHDGHTWLTYSPVKKSDWPLLFNRRFMTKYAYWGLVDPSKLPEDVVIKKENMNNFVAYAKKGTPVIDGAEDEVWGTTGDMNINIFVAGNGSQGVGKALWDENNLYVLVKVKDNNLSKTSNNAYEHDSVEIFVDEKNNKSTNYLDDDAQYRLNYENEFSFRGNPAEFKSATAITGDGYNVEVMIPFRFTIPGKGIELGFDLQINDDSGDGRRTSYSKWNDPTNESFRNTSGFGTLVLDE